MKRYTLRGLIHDAKVFNELRLAHREAEKTQRKFKALKKRWPLHWLKSSPRIRRKYSGGL
jgi:hypothetical protein